MSVPARHDHAALRAGGADGTIVAVDPEQRHAGHHQAARLQLDLAGTASSSDRRDGGWTTSPAVQPLMLPDRARAIGDHRVARYSGRSRGGHLGGGRGDGRLRGDGRPARRRIEQLDPLATSPFCIRTPSSSATCCDVADQPSNIIEVRACFDWLDEWITDVRRWTLTGASMTTSRAPTGTSHHAAQAVCCGRRPGSFARTTLIATTVVRDRRTTTAVGDEPTADHVPPGAGTWRARPARAHDLPEQPVDLAQIDLVMIDCRTTYTAA